MADAWIIDACRTPRGIGKPGKGALRGMHPQHLGATVLKALAAAQRPEHRRGRRHHLGHQFAARRAERRSGSHGGTRCGLRRALQRRHAGSLLRLRHHRGQSGGHAHHVRHGRSGDRRRHRDDVDLRTARQRAGPVHGQRQPAPARSAPATASGRVRRCHRHAGRHRRAKRWMQLALAQPATRGECDQRTATSIKSLVPVYRDDGTLALDQEEFPRPQTTLEGAVAIEAGVRRAGRLSAG